MGMDSVEIVISTERVFNIEIADHDAKELSTVGALVDYIDHALKSNAGKKSAQLTKAEILEKVVTIVADILNLPPNSISQNSHFVNDLGMDR